MGDIYGSGSGVLVWLGEEENDGDLAFSQISLWTNVGRELSETQDLNLFQHFDLILFDLRGCQAMERLFKRSWWR